ncbi:hypothetical protein CHLRE_10g467200v5 [Chlamydomonas reinhardtii]|uniref:Serine/threonine-protein kinase ATR n=1 Tax=Chlamydomonas reinhardtii TaxID=3055 RepID=A0A2K3DCC3_CHLRE|nr:uncharacterized protein CHLRE_10g467200v5 [Chlamydomonas reinhardtii]PNW78179.1 hypothetical protein CHLRE_10g467200v5 [Chlamydomonas reinhardtii]
MNSQLLLDLQAALSAALSSGSQSSTPASQNDPLVTKLRHGVSTLLDACAEASRNSTAAGVKQDVVTVLSVAEFVVERLPTVFSGQGSLEVGPVRSLLALLLAAARRFRSLLERMVSLLLRIVNLAPAGMRRSLLLDLAEGAMELMLDAEQQLVVQALDQHGGSASPRGGGGTVLGSAITAFEALQARCGAMGEEPEAACLLEVQLDRYDRCLAAAEAAAALLSSLIVYRPQLVAPVLPNAVLQVLLQLIVAATQSPGTQSQLVLCAAHIAAAGGAEGFCEGLLQVALVLVEAWGTGGIELLDTAGAASAASDASEELQAVTSSVWHAAISTAMQTCCRALENRSIVALYADRLCRLCLRHCATAATGGLHSPYLANVHTVLDLCPHLLPVAVREGLLDVLLLLPHVLHLPAAGGQEPKVPAPHAPLAASVEALRLQCAEWLAEPHVATAVADRVAAVLLLPPGGMLRKPRMLHGGGSGRQVGQPDSGAGAAPSSRPDQGQEAPGLERSLSADPDQATLPIREESVERPTKRLRRVGGGGKQQASQAATNKFGNLQDMFASQHAIKQRALAEARSTRDGGTQLAAHAVAADSASGGNTGDRRAAADDLCGVLDHDMVQGPAGGAVAAAAAAVVQLVAVPSVRLPGCDLQSRLELLGRFGAELLPLAGPELLLLAMQSAVELVRQACSAPGAATGNTPSAAPTCDPSALTVPQKLQAAVYRTSCVLVLAVLRALPELDVGMDLGGPAAVTGPWAVAWSGGMQSLMDMVLALVQPLPEALSLVPASQPSFEEVAVASAGVFLRTALCTAGCCLAAAVLPPARHPPSRSEGLLIASSSQCTGLEKSLKRLFAAMGSGGVGEGGPASAEFLASKGTDGSQVHVAGDGRRLVAAVLGAFGRTLVMCQLPIGMILPVMDVTDQPSPDRKVVFNGDRMGGPDGIAAAMLDEFAGALQRARSGQASTKVPEAPGFGAEAALAGGLQVAAGLLASSQASHVACAARKAVVLGLRQVLGGMRQVIRELAQHSSSSDLHPGTRSAAVALSAAAACLPHLPDELWLALDSLPAADRSGAGAEMEPCGSGQPAWPPLTSVLKLVEPWLGHGGAEAAGASCRAPAIVQVAMLSALRDVVHACPASCAANIGATLAQAVFAALRSPHGVVRAAGTSLLLVCLRPDTSAEIFMSSAGSTPNTAARDVLSRLHGIMSELRSDAAAIRCSLLFSAVGLLADDREARLPGMTWRDSAPQLLLMVLGCLGAEDQQVRAAASSALGVLTASLDLSAQQLLLEGPHATMVLNTLGCSVLTSPRLLPELCRLLNATDAQLVRAIVPHAIGPLCCSNRLDELRELARRLDLPPAEMFTLHAHHAYAYAFWKEPAAFDAFMERVEREVLERGHGDVVGRLSMARMLTKQTIIMAGEPSDSWHVTGSLEPPAGLHERIEVFMRAIAAESREMETDDFVQELLLGEVAAGLFELFGKQLAQMPGSSGAISGPPTSARPEGPGGAPMSPGRARHHHAVHHQAHLLGSDVHHHRASAVESVDAEALQALRSLCVLVLMLGKHLPGHVPPVMVLLTAAVSRAITSSMELQLQSLAGWRVFLRCLAATAPSLLERVAVQASVVLLPLLQSPCTEVSTSAAGVLTLLVVDNKERVRKALSRMPPLPAEVPGLEQVAQVLQEELQLADRRKRLAQLADSLQHDSLEVRHVALGELRFFLTDQRAFMCELVQRGCSGRTAVGAGMSPESSRAVTTAGTTQKLGKRAAGAAGIKSQSSAGAAADAALLAQLLSALLRCCENTVRTRLGKDIRIRCGECLGLLGALDPARVAVERRAPPDLVDQDQERGVAGGDKGGGSEATGALARSNGGGGQYALEVSLVENLVRVMETTGDLTVYRFTSYALQCLLQHYTGGSNDGGVARITSGAAAAGGRPGAASPEPEGLYWEIRPDIRPLVKPYLTTRYTLEDVGRGGRPEVDSWLVGNPLFNSPKRPSYRRWMTLWIRAMLRFAVGPHQAAFNAMMPVMRQDLPLMTFMLPQVVHAVLVSGNATATEAVRREVVAVLQAGAAGPSEADGQLELYLQALFGLLDVLGRWVKDAWQAAGASGSTQVAAQAPGGDNISELPARAQHVRAFIESIPMETLARAASRCGAHARAVQTFETHMRSEAIKAHAASQSKSATSGGLNPAADVSRPQYKALNADVSFLLEAYGQLGEPDGLAGLCAMRPSGLSEADQVLVAERAGQWGDAMALYESAMRREAPAAEEPNASAFGAAGAALGVLGRSSSAGAAAPRQGGHRVPGADGDDSASSGALSTSQAGYMRCLLAMGHTQAVLSSVDGLLARGMCTPSAAKHFAALGVAASWRLGRWSLLRGYLHAAELAGPEPGEQCEHLLLPGATLPGSTALSAGDQWELDIGHLLDTLQRGNWARVRDLLEGYREESMAVLPALAQESYVRAYPHMVRLHMMQELSDVLSLLDPSCGWTGLSANERARRLRWPDRMSSTQASLPTQEPLLSFRRQLSALMGDREAEAAAWLATAKLCRANGHLDAATSAVLEAATRGVGAAAALESAKLLRARDLHHRAASELQSAIHELSSAQAAVSPAAAESRRMLARLKLCLARWSAGQGGCAPAELRRLFDEALDSDRAWDKPHFHYARYLDQIYQDARRRQTGLGGKPMANAGRSAGERFGGRVKIMIGDERQYYEYLPDVLRHYGEAITKGQKHVMQALPRMLTLYCEHGSDQLARGTNQPRTSKENRAATEVLNTMKQLAATAIAPPKWLVALPQLISRIAHANKEVSEVIRIVLVRLGEAFPHQVLWSAAAVTRSAVPKRRDAAAEVMKLVSNQGRRTSNSYLLTVLEQFNSLSEQLIRLCHWQPQQQRNRIVTTASAHRDFEHLVRLLPCEVMVPNQEQFRAPLPPAAAGSRMAAEHPAGGSSGGAGVGLIKISALKDELQIMQSLMKPKKLTFVGSDGLDYSFLAKPKDDLRKDYRLMDFAGLLNALFASDAASRRRGLRIRTYAVVALTEDCGILQWVDGLTPFKGALEDLYISERVYAKKEWQVWIKKLWDSWTEPANKSKLLSNVLARLPPRMHRWLLNKYPEPATWLSARNNFTRTNAVWCMVGHMLGLGDRHGENILLDTTCGDTVHVDFGCLFDKGLTLEVPEMVPFRLTQNVIDGFGITGVEGVFRRCSETTLQVLRQHRDTLMTCAETFLHDPLVEWAARGQGQGQRPQDGGLGEAENPAAKDALATIEGRLTGTLLGVQSIPTLQLSCEGQAARLISEASDKENLGRMYVWWMPWM